MEVHDKARRGGTIPCLGLLTSSFPRSRIDALDASFFAFCAGSRRSTIASRFTLFAGIAGDLQYWRTFAVLAALLSVIYSLSSPSSRLLLSSIPCTDSVEKLRVDFLQLLDGDGSGSLEAMLRRHIACLPACVKSPNGMVAQALDCRFQVLSRPATI